MRALDRIIIGCGTGLAALGIGMLVTSQFVAASDPFMLGGLLWLSVGGATVALGKRARKNRALQEMR